MLYEKVWNSIRFPVSLNQPDNYCGAWYSLQFQANERCCLQIVANNTGIPEAIWVCRAISLEFHQLAINSRGLGSITPMHQFLLSYHIMSPKKVGKKQKRIDWLSELARFGASILLHRRAKNSSGSSNHLYFHHQKSCLPGPSRPADIFSGPAERV